MVDVGDTSHRNKRNVMQHPADNRVDTCIMDMIDTSLVEVVISTLPSDKVEDDHSNEGSEGGSRAPVHHWIAKEEVFDNVVIPAAHAESDVKDGPLPILRCEVVLLIRVGYKGIVGGHHCNVQMDKVAEERRLVSADISLGEFLVPVRLDVPVCEHIAGVALLGASNFDLFKPPLWEIHIASTQVAAETGMSQTERSGKGTDLAVIPACGIGHNLNSPVVFVVADSHVTIARHFVVGLGNRGLNSM